MPSVAALLALVLALSPQGIDLSPLLRRLFNGKGDAESAPMSSAIRVHDERSGRRATVRVVDERDGVLLALAFDPHRERLFAHTFQLELDEVSHALRVLPLPPESEDPEREVVLAMLSTEVLAGLRDAGSVRLSLRGWDESFDSRLDAKSVKKLREFVAGVSDDD